MPDEQANILWDEISDADRTIAMNWWWAKAAPEPGSDEYLILQMMSGPEMGHGDPDEATKELAKRGLLESHGEHRRDLTESGRKVFWSLYGKAFPVTDMATAEPTPEGVKRHPPDGYFRTDAFGEPESDPCTCTVDCPEWCDGECGCLACGTRHAVYAAPGSVQGEQ